MYGDDAASVQTVALLISPCCPSSPQTYGCLTTLVMSSWFPCGPSLERLTADTSIERAGRSGLNGSPRAVTHAAVGHLVYRTNTDTVINVMWRYYSKPTGKPTRHYQRRQTAVRLGPRTDSTEKSEATVCTDAASSPYIGKSCAFSLPGMR